MSDDHENQTRLAIANSTLCCVLNIHKWLMWSSNLITTLTQTRRLQLWQLQRHTERAYKTGFIWRWCEEKWKAKEMIDRIKRPLWILIQGTFSTIRWKSHFSKESVWGEQGTALISSHVACIFNYHCKVLMEWSGHGKCDLHTEKWAWTNLFDLNITFILSDPKHQ